MSRKGTVLFTLVYRDLTMILNSNWNGVPSEIVSGTGFPVILCHVFLFFTGASHILLQCITVKLDLV